MIVKINQMYLQTCLQTHQGELIIVTDASTELEQAGRLESSVMIVGLAWTYIPLSQDYPYCN